MLRSMSWLRFAPRGFPRPYSWKKRAISARTTDAQMAERGQDDAVEVAQSRRHHGRLPRPRALDVFGGELRQRRAGSRKGNGTPAALLAGEEGERGVPRLAGLHRVRLAECDPARFAIAPEAEHPGLHAVRLDAYGMKRCRVVSWMAYSLSWGWTASASIRRARSVIGPPPHRRSCRQGRATPGWPHQVPNCCG